MPRTSTFEVISKVYRHLDTLEFKTVQDIHKETGYSWETIQRIYLLFLGMDICISKMKPKLALVKRQW